MKKIIFLLLCFVCVTQNTFSQIIPFSDRELEIVSEYHDEMESRCNIAAEDAFSQLRLKYFVYPSFSEYLQSLFLERETRKASYDYMGLSSEQRVVSKMMIDSLYQDSIDAKLLLYNDIAGEALSLALRLKSVLKIDDNVYHAILTDGIGIVRQKRNLLNRNYDVLEMNSLKRNLSRKQINTLLCTKNVKYVSLKTDSIWNKIQKAGLTESLDSVKEYARAYNYILQEKNIFDLYVGNEKLVRNNINDLKSHKPLVIRLLESLNDGEKKEKNKSVNKNMVW